MNRRLFISLLLIVFLLTAGCSRLNGTVNPEVGSGSKDNQLRYGEEPATDGEVGKVIVSDNLVQTDAGMLINDLNKEIDLLLRDLEEMDNFDENDLN